MANWYYCNENGEKIGPIRCRELKALAKQGVIMPGVHTAIPKSVPVPPIERTDWSSWQVPYMVVGA